MDGPRPAAAGQNGLTGPVFISYATADRKQALRVCKAIERRGPECWVSTRDVKPGENYQEAIVRTIRTARAVVLVFSQAANDSDEIKKELSLASRYRVPVLALRIEDVEPSDAFAYELSTRQWIDAFEGWDRAVDSLVARIGQISGAEPVAVTVAAHAPRNGRLSSRRPVWIAAAAALLLLFIVAGAWRVLRPSKAAAHSMTVRLAGFQPLSRDLPATMPDSVSAEITAAFNADGVIGVSTASAPPPGSLPAYALGGTIDRVGNSIRVITRLTNERSGAILWSDSNDYAADELSRVPRRIAVDAGTVVRCGLFGASTYRKALPDPVLKDYMLYCQGYWSFGGRKTLIPAQRVVAAAPDFSWGWSAVTDGFMQVAEMSSDRGAVEEARAGGLRAADKAVALDAKNSEALAHRTTIMDAKDWVGKERLLKRAIAARPLDCGCEHYIYGWMLASVGRVDDAIEQYRHATDMLALWYVSQSDLGNALVAKGKLDQARSHFDAAADLSTDPGLADWLAVTQGTETGDYASAIKALRKPQFGIPAHARAAFLSGYQALASGDARAKSTAVQALVALPSDEQNDAVGPMLAALGATRQALQIVSETAASSWAGSSLFWRRSMRGVLDEPAFLATATQLGLVNYWKASHTRPDVCEAAAAPSFCRSI